MDLLVSSDQPWFCIVLHNHIVSSLETDLRGGEGDEREGRREEEGGQREGRGRSGLQFTVELCEIRDLPVRCQLP